MEVETFSYQDESWSDRGFPDLDSERTLVLAFADSRFFDKPAPFASGTCDLHNQAMTLTTIAEV